MVDWYERRHLLNDGQVFTTIEGDIVRLDRRVTGDGTKWFVADYDGSWSYWDRTIEPGELFERLPNDFAA